MNKNIIIGIVLILLIAGGAYALRGKNSSPSGTQTVKQAVSESEEFVKAIESGKPTNCVLTKNAEKMEYFIKGKKMLTNLTTIIENKTVVSHMINDEKFLYMWTDDQKQGSKISLQVSPLPTSSSNSTPSTPKFESETDYQNFKNDGYTITCKSSNIDDSAFVPPIDIKFTDPTEIMKAFPSPKADGTIDMKQLEELQKQYGGNE